MNISILSCLQFSWTATEWDIETSVYASHDTNVYGKLQVRYMYIKVIRSWFQFIVIQALLIHILIQILDSVGNHFKIYGKLLNKIVSLLLIANPLICKFMKNKKIKRSPKPAKLLYSYIPFDKYIIILLFCFCYVIYFF